MTFIHRKGIFVACPSKEDLQRSGSSSMFSRILRKLNNWLNYSHFRVDFGHSDNIRTSIIDLLSLSLMTYLNLILSDLPASKPLCLFSNNRYGLYRIIYN